MAQGIQRRIQPDLVDEIERFSGGSFSEKLLKWRDSVDRMSRDDVKGAVEEALRDARR